MVFALQLLFTHRNKSVCCSFLLPNQGVKGLFENYEHSPKVSQSQSIFVELQILVSFLCLLCLMVVDISTALTKCMETASSVQPLLCAAGQGEREQSHNPAFRTASPPLAPFEGPVAAGVTWSRRTC